MLVLLLAGQGPAAVPACHHRLSRLHLSHGHMDGLPKALAWSGGPTDKDRGRAGELQRWVTAASIIDIRTRNGKIPRTLGCQNETVMGREAEI